jgi:hypothetical protein
LASFTLFKLREAPCLNKKNLFDKKDIYQQSTQSSFEFIKMNQKSAPKPYGLHSDWYQDYVKLLDEKNKFEERFLEIKRECLKKSTENANLHKIIAEMNKEYGVLPTDEYIQPSGTSANGAGAGKGILVDLIAESSAPRQGDRVLKDQDGFAMPTLPAKPKTTPQISALDAALSKLNDVQFKEPVAARRQIEPPKKPETVRQVDPNVSKFVCG